MKNAEFQFEVFCRELGSGEISDFYASGSAPSADEAREMALGYTKGDLARTPCSSISRSKSKHSESNRRRQTSLPQTQGSKSMKVYRVVLSIIDFDQLGGQGIKDTIENQKYTNYCIRPHVRQIDEADMGEWDDAHALNHAATSAAYFEELFKLKAQM